MRRVRLLVLLSSLVLAGALALPAGALAKRWSAHAGDVSAVLTYTSTTTHPFRNARLTISRAGQQAYTAPVKLADCGSYCAPGEITVNGKSPLAVADIEGGDQPDVILGLFTGGAHCCFWDEVFSLDPGTMTYVMHDHDFADPGANLAKVDGKWEFVSADASFEYAFDGYAVSGFPLQIWSFTGGAFTNTTRQFPALIRTDAASWWKVFTHHYAHGEGAIGAWAADEDLLGNEKLVASTLAKQLRLHHLRTDPGFPAGQKFINLLQKLLRTYGYTS